MELSIGIQRLESIGSSTPVLHPDAEGGVVGSRSPIACHRASGTLRRNTSILSVQHDSRHFTPIEELSLARFVMSPYTYGLASCRRISSEKHRASFILSA